MASSTSTLTRNPASHPAMDCREMDAARALLGVSPSIAPIATIAEPLVDSAFSLDAPLDAHDQQETWGSSSGEVPRSRAQGLDALAALASTEQAKFDTNPASQEQQQQQYYSHGFLYSSSDDDDSEAMPPPPPRGRRRSASNPEAMEKWGSLYSRNHYRSHFVLPASILEEELAEASAAILKRAERSNSDADYSYDVSPDSVLDHDADSLAEDDDGDGDEQEKEEEEDLSNMTPDELLRRARSRLLEDLSEGTMNGEKGELALPHALAKYKQIYNQNGRIGIYTPSERGAIIARYNDKRTRRNWNKKIRYNCRKSLADRRLRVKGRFVKRSEQEQLAKQLQEAQASDETAPGLAVVFEEGTGDEDMPDINDPDAGFRPTEEQPYRRLRRHTIT